MKLKILVVGLQSYDAGKTTLCKALIYGFKEIGINLTPFKPHSGISYWNQFDAFKKCIEKGSLFSSDIMELEDIAKSGMPLEILNPVNRLSRPIVNSGLPVEKLTFQEFIAERFTHHDDITHKNIYYLNGKINFSQMRDLNNFYLRIKKNAEKTRFIKQFKDLLEVYVNNFDRATSSCYKHIKDKPLLIESFNDAAYPFNATEECNGVLCVSSNIILQFDRSRYFKAIEAYEGSKSKLQLTVSNIYASSLIQERFHIQPLSHREVSDPEKLMMNYGKIIQQLTKLTKF